MPHTPLSFDGLRIAPPVAAQLRAALARQSGLILIAGKACPGVKATAAAVVCEHAAAFGAARSRLAVVSDLGEGEHLLCDTQSVELPWDSVSPGARAEQILKTVATQDPGLIALGPLVSDASANLAVGMAMGQRVVVASLHASSAVHAANVLSVRLRDDLLGQLHRTDALIVAERALKAVCPVCGEHSAPTRCEREALAGLFADGEAATEMPATIARRNPDGCPACYQGYGIPLLVHETLRVTEELAAALLARKHGDAAAIDGCGHLARLTQARSHTFVQGAAALLQHGYKASDGARYYPALSEVLQ